jgi:hypothetical protein
MAQDEPVMGPDFDFSLPKSESEDPSLPKRLEKLLEDQRYAVLCTQGEGQPYASIVAFVVSEDLSAAAFSTPISTRKYELLTNCNRVALFVDNRSRGQEKMMEIEAFTATGRAIQLEQSDEWTRWSQLLVDRHPQLEFFVKSPSCALFRIDIIRYFHVSRFQEVRQWTPPRAG